MPEASDVRWAKAFARLGGRVFPWRMIEGDKIPLVSWKTEASRHPLDIDEMAMMYPDRSGWGYVPSEGQMVVDLDVKRGYDGPGAWERECWDRMEPPEATISWRTRSGGLAKLYRCDGHVPNSAGKLAKGIDTRGPSGWQAIPGSDGYEILDWNDGRLASVPTRVPAKLREAKPASDVAPADVGLDEPQNIDRATRWLRGTKPAVEGDGGDQHTYNTACVLRDMGVSAEKAHELMLEHWNERCDPPWDHDELAQKVANAYSYANREPGTKAARDPIDIFRNAPQIQFAEDRKPASDNPFTPVPWSKLNAIPKTPMLVEGLVVDKAVGMIYGPPKEYKGFISTSMAVCVATGTPFHGKAVEKRKVIVVTQEDVEFIHSRIRAFCELNGVRQPGDDELLVVPRVPDFMEDGLEELALFAQALQGLDPGWIIVDHMGDAMASGDVKDATDARAVFDRFVKLQKAADCAVTVLHHENADGNLFGSRYFLAKSEYVLHQKKDGTASVTELKWAKGLPTGETITLMGEPVTLEHDGETADVLAFRMDPHGAVECTEGVQKAQAQAAAKEHRERPDPSTQGYQAAAAEALAEIQSERELSPWQVAREVADRRRLGTERDTLKRIADYLIRTGWKDPKLRPHAIIDGKRASGFRTAGFHQQKE